MAELSFMESMKDKMSRVGGCAFSEHVEEATSELLLEPDPEKIAQLVHFGTQGGEHVPTLLNAVRRRIDNKKAKVQCFTVVVLDALIRRCPRDLHQELVNQKGLLRDLVVLAAGRDANTEAEMRARDLAATLGSQLFILVCRTPRRTNPGYVGAACKPLPRRWRPFRRNHA
jgi:hypothetical protein